ncbi:MAG: MalY/PatB family protein [Gemmiger sp.]
MSCYNFDAVVDRRGTNSLKYDFAVERGRPADVLPLWVADMDFPAPPCALQALEQAVRHGIFGYSDTKSAYTDAVTGWFGRRFGWQPRGEWLVKTPGVVFALAMAIRAATRPGDGVLIQPPVYYPFFEVVRDNDRRLVESPLVYRDGRYTMDFADLERRIEEQSVSMLLLCSPHNPVGRVWTPPELERLGDICRRHGVTVVSDEIHCDFAFPAHPHTPFLKACPGLAGQTILCTAPSKSFNLAGLQVSNIFIPDAALRAAFQKEIRRAGYSQLNTLGLVACQAAYEGGSDWLDAVCAYMRGNLDFLRSFLRQQLPQLRLVEPEGTYFAWVDFGALGLERHALNELILRDARLWLDAGHIFGGDSGQFQRIVLACPRATLEQALQQLKRAVDALEGGTEK